MRPTWSSFSDASPDLAGRVRARFETHPHHVLGTLTSVGHPRLSGTEVRWWNGDVWLGAMPGARKSADLKRDSRYALHSRPDDIDMTEGDAKLAGHANLVSDPNQLRDFAAFLGRPSEDPYDLFCLTVESASLVQVSDDHSHLVIDVWSPTDGTRTVARH